MCRTLLASGPDDRCHRCLRSGLSELESIARAYPLLDVGRHPIGAGPWRFESYDAAQGRLVLVADGSYHGEPARTERVVVTRSQDEARIEGLLREHALDWWAAPSYRRDVDWAAGSTG